MTGARTTSQPARVEEAWELLVAAERNLGLFEIMVGDVRIWERIRVSMFHRLLEAKGIREAPHDPPPRNLARSARVLKSTLGSSPFSAPPADVVLIGHPRRKPHPDGTWWDLYCDPVITNVLDPAGLSSILLERPFGGRHRQPARTRNIRHLDALSLRAAIARKLSPLRLTTEETAELERLRRGVCGTLDLDIDVVDLARRELARRESQLPLYRELFEQLRPRLMLFVVSYGNETLIEAAKDLGITTAEIQHGTIDPYHPGYAFPDGPGSKHSFPDYYLAFGSHWTESTPLPVPADHILQVGYPYLEQQAADLTSGGGDDLLFLSQGTVGTELSKCAVELATRGVPGVTYKLHPGEVSRWRSSYPWLVDSGVDVVEDDEIPLYERMACARAQVGVYSTALYEGLYLGLPTFLLATSGAPDPAPLEALGDGVTATESPDELVAALSGDIPAVRIDRDRLFAPGSTARFTKALELLIPRG